MARKGQQLTCTFYINGQQVERLTEEQLSVMARRLGEAMSIYYTAHPDEYIKFKGEKINGENHHPLQTGDRAGAVRRRPNYSGSGEHPSAYVPGDGRADQ